MNPSEFDPRTRELCDVTTCIGVLNDYGVCKICGTVSATAVLPERLHGLVEEGSVDSVHQDDDLSTDQADSDQADSSADLHSSAITADSDVDDRQLCVDELCIGVVGDDGLCKVCAKPARSQLGPG